MLKTSAKHMAGAAMNELTSNRGLVVIQAFKAELFCQRKLKDLSDIRSGFVEYVDF